MNKIKIKILCAEDDEITAKLTKAILENEYFEVMIASDGVEALKMYKEWKPDIILTDLEMGGEGKDGLELVANIRELDRKIHIIVYTSHGEPVQEVAVLDAGADEFINKERPPEVLISHMNRIRKKILKNENIPHIHELSSHTTYNSVTRELTIDGQTIRLKGIEGRLLQLLCAKHHEVANKSYIIQGIWDSSGGSKDSEVKKYISLLRAKLKGDPSLVIEYRDNGYILLLVNL